MIGYGRRSVEASELLAGLSGKQMALAAFSADDLSRTGDSETFLDPFMGFS